MAAPDEVDGASSAPLRKALRRRALAWLAQREHSRAELAVKLRRAAARLAAAPGDLDAARGARRRSSTAVRTSEARSVEVRSVEVRSVETGSVEGEARAHEDRFDDDVPDAAAVEPLIESLLDALVRDGWLSDRRFVEGRVRVRSPRFGLRRIEQELEHAGASLDAPTRHALQETEVQRAHALWARRFGSAPESLAERARQSRFLVRRGFGGDVVARVVPGAAADDRAADVDEGGDD